MTNLKYLIAGLKAGMYDVPPSTAELLQQAVDALSAAEPKQPRCEHKWEARWQQSMEHGTQQWAECIYCGVKATCAAPPAAEPKINAHASTAEKSSAPLQEGVGQGEHGHRKWPGECFWADCNKEAIYCEGHAREFVDPLGRLAAPPAAEQQKKQMVVCPKCNGCGFDDPAIGTWPCPDCKGDGVIASVGGATAPRE